MAMAQTVTEVVKDKDKLRSWIGQGILTAFAVIAILLLWYTIDRIYFNVPPVRVIAKDAEYLGEFCPGEEVQVNNRVEIEKPVVLVYYISTQEAEGLENIIGTQTFFPGMPHEVVGAFDQEIPWTVPDLPPGRYRRQMSIRGTDGREDPLFVRSFYTIKEKSQCKKEAHLKRSAYQG